MAGPDALDPDNDDDVLGDAADLLPSPGQFEADRMPEVVPYVEQPGDLDLDHPMSMAKAASTPGSSPGQSSTPPSSGGAFTEVGSSGLAQYGGFVRDEFLPALQGDKALRVWREMYDNDPIVGSIIFAIQMLLRKVEWRVEPPEAASVEDIVAEREQDRAAAAMEQRQAAAQRMMTAQAGAAAGMTPSTAAGPNGKPAPGAPPQRGQASRAQGVLDKAPGFHQGLQPTQPGNNQPATANGPGSNPSGGAAQQQALGGQGGLPALGDKPGKMSKARREWLRRITPFAKAGSSSGGGTTGDLDALPPGTVDPDTDEPMDFPIGLGPTDAPTPEEHAAELLAVFVETCLHDMADTWADVVSQIMTMVVFGFAFHELVYKKRNGPNPATPSQGSKFNDGKIGWSKIAGRAQETRHRWEFDDNGNVVGMWQMAPPNFKLVYIPLQKALLFRTTAYKGNPEGRSCLRPAFRPWYFKRRIEEIEAIGIERDLAGLPVAYVPYQIMTSGATPEEKATLAEIKKVVRNLRRDEQEGVVFPTVVDPDTKVKLYELTLLSASGARRNFDTDKIIARYEQRIAMVVLADFILLGHESVGAKSLGETKADLFTTALEAWLTVVADVFNTYAIPRLLQINGDDPARTPKLTFGKLTRISLTELAAFITALAGAGADLFPDTQLEDYLREVAGLPPKAASDDL